MYCYIGGKGSGKSYSCVQNVCLPAFKQGIPVVTNIPLNVDLIRKDFIHADVLVIEDMTLDDIINTPAGSILVIDEIQLICGSGITYAKISNELLEFFSKSRHKVDKGRAINIVVISQTLDGIGKPIKALIDTLYKCRKMSVIGASGRYQVRQYEMSGGSIMNKKPTVTANGKYSKDVYKYYSSNSQNTSDNVVQIKEKLVKEKTIFNNKLVLFSLIAPFLLAFLFYFYFPNFFQSFLGYEQPPKVAEKPLLNKFPLKNNSSMPLRKIPKIKPKKYAIAESTFGNPIVFLNGLRIDNTPFFLIESKKFKVSIPSVSIHQLRVFGFIVKRINSDLYIVNDKLVSHKEYDNDSNPVNQSFDVNLPGLPTISNLSKNDTAKPF